MSDDFEEQLTDLVLTAFDSAGSDDEAGQIAMALADQLGAVIVLICKGNRDHTRQRLVECLIAVTQAAEDWGQIDAQVAAMAADLKPKAVIRPAVFNGGKS